jgi:DNA-binding NtrC family response regulator
MIESGGFRQDLYYRLNVLYITLPALRNRKEDIELLCRHFLKQWNSFMDAEFFESLLPAMQTYNWPGNVRELQNVAQRLSFLSQNNVYNNGNLRDMARILGIEQKGSVEGGVHLRVDIEDGLKEAVAQAERAIIKSMLEECRGDYDEVARRLKIGRTTLWRKNGRNENEDEEI